MTTPLSGTIGPSGQTAPTTSTTPTNPTATLGQNDFLQLLVAQLKYQDPMKPTDQSQFMGEMAQFSTVQGVTNLSTSLASLNHSSDVSQGVALIGKQVSYEASDGSLGTGVVSSVSSVGGAVTVHLPQGDLALTDVLAVTDPTATETTPGA